MKKIESIMAVVREIYGQQENVFLHAPVFKGNEKAYLADCIDSTFVSYVGKYVSQFEKAVCDYTGAKFCIAVVNGTTALHIALISLGVKPGDEVICQPLTFVATCNAVKHAGAFPVFVDVDKDSMGMSPESLQIFLTTQTELIDGCLVNKNTRRRIVACMPMHSFGHPVRIQEIAGICNHYGLPLVEDTAESLGSFVGEVHTGNFGVIGAFSFNGNKTVTTGGGGMVVTNNEKLADHVKHLTTTAKLPHRWEFYHNEVGYNYRMPNINAAVGCAQMEQLPDFLNKKREVAEIYRKGLDGIPGVQYFAERKGVRANYWLNAILLDDLASRNEFLEITNQNGIMTRPIWILMTKLPMFQDCFSMKIPNAEWLEERVVNLPSGVPV